MDYRYVPEPDILPIVVDESFIAECQKMVVELPVKKRIRYLEEYKLKEDDARILTADYELSKYFDTLVELSSDAQKSCSYITSVLLALMNDSDDLLQISELNFKIEELAQVIKLVNNDELSSTNAKQVIEELFHKGGRADEIIDSHNLRQKNDL